MSELSREQVKALREVCRRPSGTHPAALYDHLAPTVAAMLDQARAEENDRIRVAVTQPHVRESTDHGPDFCRTCSDAIADWVSWPCPATEDARIEARTEGAAAVVADVRDALSDLYDPQGDFAPCQIPCAHSECDTAKHVLTEVDAALARHAPAEATLDSEGYDFTGLCDAVVGPDDDDPGFCGRPVRVAGADVPCGLPAGHANGCYANPKVTR